MAQIRVVYDQANSGKVEFKTTPESGNNHLVYLFNPLQLIVNGDGANTTDWIDTDLDGLADNWSNIMNP